MNMPLSLEGSELERQERQEQQEGQEEQEEQEGGFRLQPEDQCWRLSSA
jgi:hypothetical protein